MPVKTVAHPPKNWRFRVSKLGALTHGGEFEIKPLTLFCGENNTGKTWAMYAAYSFLRMRRLPSIGLLQSFFSGNSTQKSFPYKKWLEKNWKVIVAKSNKAMSDSLPVILKADKGQLNGAKIEWEAEKSTLINNAIRSGWKTISISPPDGTVTVSKAPNAEEIEIISTGKVNKDSVLRDFPMFSTVIGCRHAFLIPAERCGLNLFYKELRTRRTALFHNTSKKDMDKIFRYPMSRYADPIADYIDWLDRVSNEKTKTPYSDIAKFLATKLAGGKYRVDKESNIFFTPRKNRGTNTNTMGLHTTSSTVKSIFGLWYYLQHEARSGDVVMIDEPEINLHPASQLALARILAQMVNAGLYVVASTHSDYIVREINTLLVLNKKEPKLRDALMKKHKINKSELLASDLVGAYEMSAKNGRVEPMNMGNEGINAKTLDNVISAQGKASDDVYFS